MVEKIRFNVHLPYIMTLVDFFMGSVDTGTLPDMPDMPVAPHPIHAPDGNAAASASTSFSVYGSLKQPEIVFFADPSSPESRVIVLYVSKSFWKKQQLKVLFRQVMQLWKVFPKFAIEICRWVGSQTIFKFHYENMLSNHAVLR